MKQESKAARGVPHFNRPARQRERKYGITSDAFERLLDSQGGRCAVCGGTGWGKKGPHLDHDHRTGAVRGIVCLSCNFAMGWIREDAQVAKNMAAYLDRNKIIYGGTP
jgi:hypothetical protein